MSVTTRFYITCAAGFVSAVVLAVTIGYGSNRVALLQPASRWSKQMEQSREWAKAHAGGEPLIKQWNTEFHSLIGLNRLRTPESPSSPKDEEEKTKLFASIESLLMYGIFGMSKAKHSKPSPEVKVHQLAQIPKTRHSRPKLIEVLPKHWKAYIDDGTGRPYYYNAKTKQSLWSFPQLDGTASSPQDFDAAVTQYAMEGDQALQPCLRKYSGSSAQSSSKAALCAELSSTEKMQELHRDCGILACDPFKGCDGKAFTQCAAAVDPESGDPALTRLQDRSAESEIIKETARGCGAEACDVKKGCDDNAYFACLIRNSNDEIRQAVSEGFVDFPRDGVDLSHGFDDIRSTTKQALVRNESPVKPHMKLKHLKDRAKLHRLLATTSTDKGVFAPHSLEPSARANAERAVFEKEIRATADSIFSPDPLTAFASENSRFPTLTGQMAAVSADPKPATKSEVTEILRHTIKNGHIEARKSNVLWDQAVHKSFPPPWEEDTSRDHEANKALYSSEHKDQLLHRAFRPRAAFARFISLADVGDQTWRRMADKGGRVYWLNSETGATQWHSPSTNALRDTERNILKETLKAGEVEGDPAQTVVPPAHIHRDLNALRSIMSATR